MVVERLRLLHFLTDEIGRLRNWKRNNEIADVVIIADARRNNGSQGNTYNTTSQLGTLSGCSNYNLLVYTVNGAYYESSTSRANLWTNVYECTLEDEGTITYTIASNNDDHNSTMLVFKK